MRGRTSWSPTTATCATTSSAWRRARPGPAPAVVRRALAVGGDADLSEIRLDYWRVRADDVAVVFGAPPDRGELRADVDPVDAIQMFVGAVLRDPIFTGSPVRPQYVAQLVDVFVRGSAGGAAG